MPRPRLCPYGFQICTRETGCTPFPDGLRFGDKSIEVELVDNCPERLVSIHMATYQQGPPSVQAMTACDHCRGVLRGDSGPYGWRDVCESCGCRWEHDYPYQFIEAGTWKSCRPLSPTRPLTAAAPVQ